MTQSVLWTHVRNAMSKWFEPARKAGGPRWRQPRLERLEDRLAPAAPGIPAPALPPPFVSGQVPGPVPLAGLSQAVAQRADSVNRPDLLVNGSTGTVTLLAGSGSASNDDGSSENAAALTINLGKSIVQSVSDPTTGQVFVVGADGSVSVLTGDHFSALPLQGVTSLTAVDSHLVASFKDGSIGVFTSQGTAIALEPLELVPPLGAFPGMTEPPPSPFVAKGTGVPGADLVLVATLLSGSLRDQAPSATTASVPEEGVFGLFLPPVVLPPAGGVGGLITGLLDRGGLIGENLPPRVTEALLKHLNNRQVDAIFEGAGSNRKEVLDPFQSSPAFPADLSDVEEAKPMPETQSPTVSEHHTEDIDVDRSPEQPILAVEPEAKGFDGAMDFDWMVLLPTTTAVCVLIAGEGGEAENA